MTWGFPQWDKKGVTINARSETAAEKKMFAKPLVERRCVIPSTGFYEWSHDSGKPKEKYLFNMDGGPMLYMAGLYTTFANSGKEGALSDRFVILTRDANQYMNDIHNRMPVILHKNELTQWLTDYGFATQVMGRDSIILTKASA
jgi:putative SOS response-associated peptidase YedK